MEKISLKKKKSPKKTDDVKQMKQQSDVGNLMTQWYFVLLVLIKSMKILRMPKAVTITRKKFNILKKLLKKFV